VKSIRVSGMDLKKIVIHYFELLQNARDMYSIMRLHSKRINHPTPW
jgi:hypothetical protein